MHSLIKLILEKDQSLYRRHAVNKLKIKFHLLLFLIKQIRWHLLSLVILISMGTIIFSILEQWNVFISFYFTIVTLSTVGYGDFVPKHDTSRLASSIIVLIGISIFALSMQKMAEHIIEFRLDPSIESHISLNHIENAIVILGYGKVGSEIAEMLMKSGYKNIVIIDSNTTRIEEARTRGLITIEGDVKEPLFLANLNWKKVKYTFISLHDDETTIFTALVVKTYDPTTNVIIHIREYRSLDLCKRLNITNVVLQEYAVFIDLNKILFKDLDIMVTDLPLKQHRIVRLQKLPDDREISPELLDRVWVIGRITLATKEFDQVVPVETLNDYMKRWKHIKKPLDRFDLLVLGDAHDLRDMEAIKTRTYQKIYENVLLLGSGIISRISLQLLQYTAKEIWIATKDEDILKHGEKDDIHSIPAHMTEINRFSPSFLKKMDLVIISSHEDPEMLFFLSYLRMHNKTAIVIAQIRDHQNLHIFNQLGLNHSIELERAVARQMIHCSELLEKK